MSSSHSANIIKMLGEQYAAALEEEQKARQQQLTMAQEFALTQKAYVDELKHLCPWYMSVRHPKFNGWDMHESVNLVGMGNESRCVHVDGWSYHSGPWGDVCDRIQLLPDCIMSISIFEMQPSAGQLNQIFNWATEKRYSCLDVERKTGENVLTLIQFGVLSNDQKPAK